MNKSFLSEITVENSDRGINSSFSNFLYGSKKTKIIKESMDDSALSKELVLFIENNETLKNQIPSVQKTLFKHWKKGEYSSSLAQRAWNRIVSEGARAYATEYSREPRLWEELFPVNMRQSIVEEFEENFYNNLKRGKINVEELFNE